MGQPAPSLTFLLVASFQHMRPLILTASLNTPKGNLFGTVPKALTTIAFTVALIADFVCVDDDDEWRHPLDSFPFNTRAIGPLINRVFLFGKFPIFQLCKSIQAVPAPRRPRWISESRTISRRQDLLDRTLR